jgi:hypothetical protein
VVCALVAAFVAYSVFNLDAFREMADAFRSNWPGIVDLFGIKSANTQNVPSGLRPVRSPAITEGGELAPRPRRPIRGDDFDIKVDGTPGLVFQGSYLVVSGSGTVTKSVIGVVPWTATASGSLVSVSFQKRSYSTNDLRELKVTLTKNGETVQQASTLAPHGVVGASTR